MKKIQRTNNIGNKPQSFSSIYNFIEKIGKYEFWYNCSANAIASQHSGKKHLNVLR